MKEVEEPLSIWNKYVEAKKAVLGPQEDTAAPLSIEELELAIAQTAASSGYPEMGMPPRSIVHPVKRSQLSRWFYLALLLMFSGLVMGLLWWGRHHYS